MSSAVNDPGTVIKIIDTFVRLFALWSEPLDEGDPQTPECDRVAVPQLALHEMFDDAFTAIARDGAGAIEIAVRLQKAFASLASIGHAVMQDAAIRHTCLALARAENVMELPADLKIVRKLAELVGSIPTG